MGSIQLSLWDFVDFKLSESQFPHMNNMEKNCTHFLKLFWQISEILHKRCLTVSNRVTIKSMYLLLILMIIRLLAICWNCMRMGYFVDFQWIMVDPISVLKVIWNIYSAQNIGAKTLHRTWHLLFNNHTLERQPPK